MSPAAEVSFERIKELVAKNLFVEPGQVTPEARFIEDLGADSLGMTELLMALQDSELRNSTISHKIGIMTSGTVYGAACWDAYGIFPL